MIIIKLLAIILGNALLFFLLGVILERFFKTGFSLGELWISGFFLYYALFQTVYLPVLFGAGRLSVLTNVWTAVCIAVIAVGGISLWKQKGEGKIACRLATFLKKGSAGLAAGCLAVLLLQLFLMLTNGYNGWDTAYYVGNMNTSVVTDTMYAFDGTSGMEAGYLNLRYALSGFYMHGAVWCRFLDLHPLLYCRYVTPVIGWAMASVLLYKIGAETVTKKSISGRYLFLIAAGMLNLYWSSAYTTSEFLLNRSLEAKSYCANIIMPALFFSGVRLYKNWHEKGSWLLFFLITYAADGISFSSLMLVPCLVTVICFAGAIGQKDLKILRNYAVCMAVPVLYGLVYYMYGKGLLVIGG